MICKVSLFLGDGGVVSNIKDLTKWENEFHNPKVFTKLFWDLMIRRGKLKNGQVIEYASGLIIGKFNSNSMLSYSGQNPGFSSDLIRFPEQDLSIIALGNQNWYNIRSYAINFAELFLSHKNQRFEHNRSKENNVIRLKNHELEKFCGDFHFLETNEYRSIEIKSGQLIYVRPNGPSSKLIPLSDTKLTFEDRPKVSLSFDFKANGEKTIFLKDGTITMNAKSYIKSSVEKKDLIELSSKYYNDELEMELILEIENNALMFPIFGQKIPLESITKDKFMAMGMFTLKFQSNKDGNITGFDLDAPRAKNIKFKKVH